LYSLQRMSCYFCYFYPLSFGFLSIFFLFLFSVIFPVYFLFLSKQSRGAIQIPK
jgi:hypothetical protein